jgi:hypothetical protein
MKSSYESPIFSDQEISEIAGGDSRRIAEWVQATAKERNVFVRQMTSDKFARAVSRLSDANTDLDHIERLLIILNRSRIITPSQRNLLQVRYLRSYRR